MVSICTICLDITSGETVADAAEAEAAGAGGAGGASLADAIDLLDSDEEVAVGNAAVAAEWSPILGSEVGAVELSSVREVGAAGASAAAAAVVAASSGEVRSAREWQAPVCDLCGKACNSADNLRTHRGSNPCEKAQKRSRSAGSAPPADYDLLRQQQLWLDAT